MREQVRRRLAGEDGMSLVEVVVAVVILGIILAGFAATLVSTLHSLLANESRVRSNALFNEVIENIQQQNWSDFIADVDGGEYPKTETVNRDGVDYEVVVEAVWVDDDATPLDEEDYVEITVTINWEDAGHPRTVTHHGHRAPPADEIDAGPAVRSVRADPEIGYIRSHHADADVRGKLDEKVTFDEDGQAQTEDISASQGVGLTLITTTPVNSVVASFTDRGGTVRTAPLTAQDAEDREWLLDPTATSSWRYASGDTTFHFDISSSEGDFTARKVVRYVYDTVEVGGDDPVADPQTVCVDDDFRGEHDVTLTAEFTGMTADDAVEVSGGGLDPAQTWAAEHIDDTVDGSLYGFVLEEGHPYPVASETDVTMTGLRHFDGQTADGSVELTILSPLDGEAYDTECGD